MGAAVEGEDGQFEITSRWLMNGWRDRGVGGMVADNIVDRGLVSVDEFGLQVRGSGSNLCDRKDEVAGSRDAITAG